MTYIVPSNDEEKSSLFYPMHIEDIFRSCGLIVYKISKNYISIFFKNFPSASRITASEMLEIF